MVFADKETAKIQAYLTGLTNTITIDGVTSGATTPENAKAQIDKILGIVGRSVVTAKMKQIITKEAAAE